MDIVLSRISASEYLFKINDSEKNKYALYIIEKESNTVVKKEWYQSSPIFTLKLNSDICFYKFKIYVKNRANEKKTIIYSDISDKFISNKVKDFIDYLFFDRSFEEISCFMGKFIKDDNFMFSFIPIKHGSCQITDTNFKKINKFLILNLKFLKDNISLKNSLGYLIYFLDIRNLNRLKDELFIYFDAFDAVDYLFYASVLYYRVGIKDISKAYNSRLFRYKDELKPFQGGAISYVNFEKLNNEDLNEIFIINELNSVGKGLLLVSSDFGYFKAYSEKTINSSIEYNNNIHFHLVLPNEKSISHIDIDFFIKKNIGLSYEIKDVGNNPTYYSISRYLILNEIISLYDSNVIVCDIDIKLEKNIDYIFDRLGTYKIGLVRSDKDLPWLSCLAGFNYFGKDTRNTLFLNNMRNIMNTLFNKGYDLWMLDQVALQLSLEENEENEEDDLIVNLSEYLLHSIKQYDNRQQARNIARKMTESLYELTVQTKN